MRIREIAEQTVSIASPIRNAVIDFSAMTVSAVAIKTDHVVEGRPLVGYGFSSNGRYAQGGILRERIIPRLLAAAPDTLVDASGILDPFKCWDTMMRDEKPGGHGERSVAVGTIDMALWDLVAKAEGVPLYRLLADRYRGGIANSAVEVYAAGGYYYPGAAESTLRDELKRYLDMGFTAVKMKIGGAPPADDLRRIEAAIAVTGGGHALSVDANARFDVATALAYARAMEDYRLRWYEEPVEVLDFAGLAEVAAASTTPIATGENIFSMVDARNLVRYGGLDPARDYLQMDPALSYGLVEYLRTLDMLAAHGWSARRCVPHGGHQFGLHLAAGLGLMGNEAYPGVFEPFGRFAPDMTLANGKITLTDHPGIGYESIDEIYRILSAETLS
jgi:L-alanine-DL-glutamate epimerase-like enolase superfamily enzyme